MLPRCCALLALLLVSCPASPCPGAQISWDAHSLLVDGERLVILSGEFHYWRLPSPELWPQVLVRVRAAGYNAVRIYFPWSVHAPAPGVYDFGGIRDVSAVLDACRRQGLHVLAAVGPYVCAETDAGGLPAWLFPQEVKPRCLEGTLFPRPAYDPDYVQGWTRQWYARILPILAEHQATREPGGPVLLVQVENEYPEALAASGPRQVPPRMGDRRYVEELAAMAREYGIDVPLFHNDASFLNLPYPGSWNGVVDLYGVDLYPFAAATGPGPGAPSWDTANAFRPVLDRAEALVRGLGPPASETPLIMAEYQGGWYDGWGGSGYDARHDTLGPAFYQILDKSLLAQGFTVINRYMFYGGTNWGYLSNPEVYTSYDYGAPIREWGVLTGSYAAMKRTAMGVEAFPELWGATDPVAVPADASQDPRALYRVREGLRENPDGSRPRLTFLRNGDRAGALRTRVRVPWMGAEHWVPRDPAEEIVLPERSMRVLVSNLELEGGLRLLYCTFEPLTRARQAGRRILAVHGRDGEYGETAFHLAAEPRVLCASPGVRWRWEGSAGELAVSARAGAEPAFIELCPAGGSVPWLLLILDEEQAGRTWRAQGAPGGDVLAVGPYFMPAVPGSAGPGGEAELPLWVNTPTTVRLFPADPDAVTLPRAAADVERRAETGEIRFTLRPDAPPPLPALGPWLFAAGDPETEPGFDDSDWEPVPPGGDLSPDRYGFHHGFVWYRGRYAPGPGARPAAVRLDARHCASVYWNGRYLGSHDSFTAGLLGPGAASGPDLFPDPVDYAVPPEIVREDNAIAVLVENLGHNKGYAFFYDILNPRGILSWEVVGDPGAEVRWRIQGRDPRTDPDPFNASGLYGERQGYPLPAFDDAGWRPVDLPHDWDRDDAVPEDFVGTGWYRTRFRLELPDTLEMPLCLRVNRASAKALIWLNGRLVGRAWDEKGPQTRFYLPRGLLRTAGEDNVLAVCLWRRGDEAGSAGPAVLDLAGLEPYPLDHRVSGGPAAGSPAEGEPFLSTLHRVRLGAASGGGGEPVPAAPGGGCGACGTTAPHRAPEPGSFLPPLLLLCFLRALKTRLPGRCRA